MRLFFAVNLAPAVKDGFRAALEEFPVERPPWRWVECANLHITLKFLGDMDEARVEDLARCARQACGGAHAFRLSFSEFGAFPNLKRPRVIYYSASEGAEDLRTLAESLDAVLQRELGIAREERPFNAHITVARIKAPLPGSISARLAEVPSLPGLSQTVSSIHLMQSELRRSGAVYTPVKEIALSSPA